MLVVALPSLAAAQGRECGGHFIDWIGGRPQAARPPGRQHNPPTTTPFPDGLTQYDRMLWDQLIFDAYDHPTASPGEAAPLEERHTRVMRRDAATSFNLCIQSPDEAYTGERLSTYRAAWWRRNVERFTTFQWRGRIEIGACTGVPPEGWVYVREGGPGEVKDTALAHTSSSYFPDYNNPGHSIGAWIRSEIVWHSADKVRNTSEDWFESSLAHELGHVLGFSHVDPSSGFVMVGGGRRTWPSRETWLAQHASLFIGPGVAYPGFLTPVPSLPLVGVLLLAGLLVMVGVRAALRWPAPASSSQLCGSSAAAGVTMFDMHTIAPCHRAGDEGDAWHAQ